MQMMFRTAYDHDDGEVFVSPSGQPTLDQYEYRIDTKGVKSLVKTDKVIEVQDRIQADYPSTDINLLMKRFALGDTSAINIREALYFDASEMPKTYAEMFDRIQQGISAFEKLPVELKEMFNNSPEQFYSEMETKGFQEKIDKYNERFVDHSYDIQESVSDDVVKEIEY